MDRKGPLKIAIGRDTLHWHDRFASALNAKIDKGCPVLYEVINLDRHDWIDLLEPFDLIIWKPTALAVEPASYFKEKIYLVEKFLQKAVVPNFDTVWHYDSKIAQSYIFHICKINSPSTVVSFDYHDAMQQLQTTEMPVVWKKSWGAGSRNVKLFHTEKKTRQEISRVFFQAIWDEGRQAYPSLWRHALTQFAKPWFWKKIFQKFRGYDSHAERHGVVYWQKFIAGNSADLRITIIGNQYAYGAWRNNRPNDFRASGSGRGDFFREVPEEIVKYCLRINDRLNFDSMAYDIIFDKNKFYITEMSYAYVDSFLHNCRGYYKAEDDDSLAFIEGHVWPQELWIEWALKRAGMLDVDHQMALRDKDPRNT
jgi:glutathione synthase/RimK-type ligase-like ATP-grasp enzyme